MDQNPQIHLHTTQQLPSITHRQLSPFLIISWAAESQPPHSASADKIPLGKPSLKPRTTPISPEGHTPPCHLPATHLSAELQAGSAGEGEPNVFTQTLRALDTEDMQAGFLAREPSWPSAPATAVQGFFLYAVPASLHTFKVCAPLLLPELSQIICC